MPMYKDTWKVKFRAEVTATGVEAVTLTNRGAENKASEVAGCNGRD